MEKSSSVSKGRFHSLLLTASSITGLSYVFMFNKSIYSWLSNWIHWIPTSMESLKNAEAKMLSYLQKPYETSFIPILHENEENCEIRTLIIKSKDDNKVPVVLIHGFASGIGLWILNLEELSDHRPLYAIDILGFGLSSRPNFSKDPEIAENQFVESIEQWRSNIGIDKFVLLGHSMGGFLAASYAIKYPDHVKHLILADPWGFPTMDSSTRKIQIPFWAKTLAAMLRPFNPLAGLRAVGPWGPQLISRLRPDILHKFESKAEPNDVANYIYHCNAQKPSGEAAFKAMTARFGWAKRPMLERISELRQDIPITFIYGVHSWVDSTSGLQTSALRKDCFVNIQLIQDAGHHVYADNAAVFNELVINVCDECCTEKKKNCDTSATVDDMCETC